MDSNQKCCFLFNVADQGKLFIKQLQKELNTKVDYNNCYAGFTIYVDISEYEHALQIGTKILLSNPTYMKHSCWVDYYNEVQSTNIGLIMYGFLPNTRKVEKYWIYEAPDDITLFKTELANFLNKKVYISCNCADNAVNVHIEDINEHQAIQEKVKEFLNTYKTPFEHIKYFSYIGKLES